MTDGTLVRVAAVGPYFAVSSGPRADAGDFRPFTALHHDPAPLAAYVAETARRLGTDQRRVAASTLHIGTAARLWSVALATATLTGRATDLTPERVWWRTPESGPIELWLPQVPAATAGDLPAALYETVVVRHLLPLGDALRRDFGLSPRILHGNTASALVGAVRVLLARVPDAPRSPLPVAAALLAREPLASAGVLTVDPLAYRRNSCCLYYRVPGNGFCGDCVLEGERPRHGSGGS
ncbi:(2Fe-2S)-binding protein [Streptomyces gobitricini]|uniref:Ferric siderophore reductase C-terminal domain-containing protein n=1 Tax=Streptomyces gobitricini TaxID=68211 RepID=A0ABN3M955_9ACTN